MARRRPDPVRAPRKPALNAPFGDLGKRLKGWPARPTRALTSAPPVAPPSPDDPALFSRAMEGVVPLPDPQDRRVDQPRPEGARPLVDEDAEALIALSELVAGAVDFDISDTREYIEGAVVGLDPRLVRRLRRGELAYQAHLDLHGMTAPAARAAVDAFLARAHRDGHRCVLLVHGRGLNSKDQIPVLKERLKVWLARGRTAQIVLAFATARPVDGGAGALYVLLRRDRRRQVLAVTDGAKR